MQVQTESQSLMQVQGRIHSIDAPRREMTVVVNGMLQPFDIAAECSVWLHGERVKLRILQPADLVHISYAARDGQWLAVQIRVIE
jgi:hypothetical protein